MVDGEELVIVTSGAPLGQAILGKKAGDSFTLKIGPAIQTFVVLSVE